MTAEPNVTATWLLRHPAMHPNRRSMLDVVNDVELLSTGLARRFGRIRRGMHSTRGLDFDAKHRVQLVAIGGCPLEHPLTSSREPSTDQSCTANGASSDAHVDMSPSMFRFYFGEQVHEVASPSG